MYFRDENQDRLIYNQRPEAMPADWEPRSKYNRYMVTDVKQLKAGRHIRVWFGVGRHQFIGIGDEVVLGVPYKPEWGHSMGKLWSYDSPCSYWREDMMHASPKRRGCTYGAVSDLGANSQLVLRETPSGKTWWYPHTRLWKFSNKVESMLERVRKWHPYFAWCWLCGANPANDDAWEQFVDSVSSDLYLDDLMNDMFLCGD